MKPTFGPPVAQENPGKRSVWNVQRNRLEGFSGWPKVYPDVANVVYTRSKR